MSDVTFGDEIIVEWPQETGLKKKKLFHCITCKFNENRQSPEVNMLERLKKVS